MVDRASSFVDGWAPCFLGQEGESSVCYPYTLVDGFFASTPMVTWTTINCLVSVHQRIFFFENNFLTMDFYVD